jgi:hypothetical protein
MCRRFVTAHTFRTIYIYIYIYACVAPTSQVRTSPPRCYFLLEIKRYEVGVVSIFITFVQSFVKIRQPVQKLVRVDLYIENTVIL